MPKRPPLFRPKGQRTTQERKRDHDQQRGTSAERGYDAVWRRLRVMFLNANPLCVFHQRKRETVAATVVDHIQSVRDRPDLRLEWSNLQSLCKPCHDRLRQQEQNAERRQGGPGLRCEGVEPTG